MKSIFGILKSRKRACLIFETYPGPESVVLALLVSGDVVMGVSSVPSELVLLVGGHVDVLEVAVGLLALLRLRVGGAEDGAEADAKLKKEPNCETGSVSRFDEFSKVGLGPILSLNFRQARECGRACPAINEGKKKRQNKCVLRKTSLILVGKFGHESLS